MLRSASERIVGLCVWYPVVWRMDQPAPTRVRVGGFQLNLTTGELSPVVHPEAAILLREQPFQIFKLLIDRRGKIVTREEIQKRLWPNDTVVNFDQGINAAIRILRRELGDSADSPQYIETIARRGYRLLVEPEPQPSTTGFRQVPNDPTELRKSSSEGMVGKKVSHYRVLEVIGGGGMGMVYKAEDLKLGRQVALKFLPEELADDPIALRRFEREAQTASALNHPNICTIYEIEEYEGQPFIAMELLDGLSLQHRLDAIPSKILPLPDLIDLALQICDGLQTAHGKGIIHRDIKPANIFLTTAGQAKILDFGLAKLIEPEGSYPDESTEATHTLFQSNSNSNIESRRSELSLTLTGPAMGTTGYMSPEQVRREKLDCTTDLFSFGLVLYEATTGHRAFVDDSVDAVRSAILTESPAPIHTFNSKTPRRLCSVIAKATQKDRGERYQSAIEMRRAVERAKEETDSARSRRSWLVTAAALIFAVALGIFLKARIMPPTVLSPGDTVVVAVTNKTEDLVFDEAIYAGLYWDLRQTPFFHVLDLAQEQNALAALHLPRNSGNSPEIARRVCIQSNSRLVLTARIAQEGNGFRVDEEGIDCHTGKVVASTTDSATDRSSVIHALGLATTAMRATLGEPKSSLAKFGKPLDVALSSSPEAIQLLTDGYIKLAASDLHGAASDFQRALDLDPNFVMALAALGSVDGDLGRTMESTAEISKAFELRGNAAIPVRLNVEDRYYGVVTGNLKEQERVLADWVREYPDDFFAHNNLGLCTWYMGERDRSLAETRDSLRLLPSPFAYSQLIFRQIATNRLDEADATIKEAESKGFDTIQIHAGRVILAFLESNSEELLQQWQWAENKPVADYAFLNDRGNIEGYYGQDRDARLHIMGAVNLATREGNADSADRSLGFLALLEAELGHTSRAQQILGRLSSMHRQRYASVPVALGFARTGNLAEAQQLANNIARDFPQDTMLQQYGLPIIRAAIALQQNNNSRAIEELRNTVQYDLASPQGFGDMYPAYLRGLAYLRLRQGRLAEAEFQKMIDHSGLLAWNVIGALAHLQIARAQQMSGEIQQAKASYESFLRLWKDADPDLLIYQQAKAEYSQIARKAK